MKLSLESLSEKNEFLKNGFILPKFDVMRVREKTATEPVWLHFGAGNIFRAFPAAIMQTLLDEGLADTGIIACEGFDGEIVDKAYKPFDCLSVLSTLKSSGQVEDRVIASVTEALRTDGENESDIRRAREIIVMPSLQMLSFTITEKGYAVKNAAGDFFPFVASDLSKSPDEAKTLMGQICNLLWLRFDKTKLPLAVCSMDNCSHNGDKLKNGVTEMANAWREKGYFSNEFIKALADPEQYSFPLSMIDKITPRPDKRVAEALTKKGFEDTETIITSRGTYTAAFVNAEETQYLVIEDLFPCGRPPLEKASVIFTKRETVDKVEKMKVCTCLNPLHTALAILGCLLGYTLISEEMKDESLEKLVKELAYKEGMPVVVDPKVLSPMDFARQVIDVRLTNPFMPDAPQRIATDTSQKLPIRFGETLKAYHSHSGLSAASLRIIPFVLAAYVRYLMAIGDDGQPMAVSSDPRLAELQEKISGIKLGGKNENLHEIVKPIYSDESLFAVDLYALGLGDKIENYLKEMLKGKGAVRAALDGLFK
ncbi:MAG: mannitol dehydrogenase family protein [Eubacteriales bacterium]|nr:mannitol dehydrogenase family protein [Eubacteriales bacterium]MDD3882032.1 mannitol dehydrogenase family protein [Eubacteriales bacterium]MDD4512479.1 mannitol dehydrogenase family protein [Eubacteriales bacterium]